MKARFALTSLSAPWAAALSALILGANVAIANGIFRGDALWTMSFVAGPLVVTSALAAAATALDTSSMRLGEWWPTTSKVAGLRSVAYVWCASLLMSSLAWALVMAITIAAFPPVAWPPLASTVLVLCCQVAFIGVFAALGAVVGTLLGKLWATLVALAAALAIANWGTALTTPAWNVTLGWLSPSHLVEPSIAWHLAYLVFALLATAIMLIVPHGLSRGARPTGATVSVAAACIGLLMLVGGTISTPRWEVSVPVASECAVSERGVQICVVPHQRDFLPSLTTGTDAVIVSAPEFAPLFATGVVTDGAVSGLSDAAPFSPSVTSYRDRVASLPELVQAAMPAHCEVLESQGAEAQDALDQVYSHVLDGVMVAVAQHAQASEVAAYVALRGPENPEDFTLDDYLTLPPDAYIPGPSMAAGLSVLAACDGARAIALAP